MRILGAALLTLLVSVATGCRQQPDLDGLRAEILELHHSLIQAHLDKDAAFLARPTSPDYLFVADGEVEHRSAAQVERMLAEYLESTEFSVYEDVAEPLIGIARDGSVAWAVVQVRVAGESSRLASPPRSFDTLWAWITVYERHGDGWLRVADVSTSRPYTPEP
jgi:hypothetical protein